MASISSISLSSLVINSRTGSGVDIAQVNVTLNPTNPPFNGTVSISGADAANFAIDVHPDMRIFLRSAMAILNPRFYDINLIATESGLSNSPFTQAFVLQAVDPLAHQIAAPIPFPQLSAPIVDENGNLNMAWTRFFTNVWGQTNGSPFSLNSNSKAPVAPSSGQINLYVDPADGGLKVIFSTGKVVVLGMP